MGRHTATDGSSVHPLVAEGMSHRAGATGSHRTFDGQGDQSGEVGWPAPPHKGKGLGWPGDLAVDGDDPAEPAPRGRRGWRRLFGASPAA